MTYANRSKRKASNVLFLFLFQMFLLRKNGYFNEIAAYSVYDNISDFVLCPNETFSLAKGFGPLASEYANKRK